MCNHYIKTSFVRPCLRHLGANKTGFILIIVHFHIREKLYNYAAINNYSNFERKKTWYLIIKGSKDKIYREQSLQIKPYIKLSF